MWWQKWGSFYCAQIRSPSRSASLKQWFLFLLSRERIKNQVSALRVSSWRSEGSLNSWWMWLILSHQTMRSIVHPYLLSTCNRHIETGMHNGQPNHRFELEIFDKRDVEHYELSFQTFDLSWEDKDISRQFVIDRATVNSSPLNLSISLW